MFNLLPVALNTVLQKTATIAFASKQVMIFSKNSLLYISQLPSDLQTCEYIYIYIHGMFFFK